MLLAGDTVRRLCAARDALCAVAEPAPSIEEVAREAAISPAHFIRQFEALFGLTPHQLRIRARLERARALLAADHAVTEVCFAVGFSSLGSFSALFHRRVGVAPSTYRRAQVQVPAMVRARAAGCFGLMGRLPAGAFRSFREA